jgi:hypothetical protein
MFKWMHTLLARVVVDTVPVEMDMCLECDALECSEERYRACPARKRRAAELEADVGPRGRLTLL